jgi:hypothetical protein
MLCDEVRHPRVVDADHLVRRLDVLQLRGGREDAVDDLGVDAVTLHFLDAQVRVAGPAHAFLAVLVEPRRRHHIDAQLLAPHPLGAGGADAARDAELHAVLRDPPPVAVGVRLSRHVRHPVLQVRRRFRREQIGRQPDEVEVTVRRDPIVGPHGSSSVNGAL